MPRITVVTAAWLDNTEKVKWLNECAESVLSQEFDGLEWIVVDDFSPLEPEVPSDQRVRVLRAAERQGPSKCRNTAASLAESDAIVALDADDMLAGPDVLDRLWQHWERRPDRFYYGDLQILNQGVPGKVVRFAPYNFVAALDPKGLVPVTALHSKEAWFKAGGWKPGLADGLEDVEYWISVGKAGFCGFKLDFTTILYRKHPTSRSAAMRANGAAKEKAMSAAIREMHADVYDGRLPMGCCGGRGGSGTVGAPLPIQQPRPRALLTDDLPGGKVWVRYNGQRTGTFNMRGQVTGTPYEVDGKDAEFQIHAKDAHFFQNLGRGRDFSVGIAPPVQPEPEPVVQEQQQGYAPPPPEPATVVRLDREPEPQVNPALEELNLAKQVIDEDRRQRMTIKEIEPVEAGDAAEIFEAAKDNPLEELVVEGVPTKMMDEIRRMLELERWTMPQLARAIPEELMPYPGIGKKRATDIIAKAQEIWGS